MHLAIYIPSLRGGGAERAMVTLANGFAAEGMRVDLVLASAEGPYLQEVDEAVRIVDLGARRVLASLPALIRYLRQARPQSLLSALGHANIVAAIACTLARSSARLVVSERTNASRAARKPQSLRQRAVVPLMRWAYRRADAVVAVSQGVADDLSRTIGLPRDRIQVVYNPAVPANLEALADAPLDHPWVEGGQPPLVLAAGRLTPAKDYPTLIRAFATVRAQRVCHLVILGEGELRNELEDLVRRLGLADSVELPGFSPNPFAWMRRASVFVLSSAWEGLPNVLIQAMACGTPVVSTNCPSGPYEILEGGRWGALTPVGDWQKLSESIGKVLDGAGLNARTRAKNFGLQESLEGYAAAAFPKTA